jgi:hypothetical protein
MEEVAAAACLQEMHLRPSHTAYAMKLINIFYAEVWLQISTASKVESLL